MHKSSVEKMKGEIIGSELIAREIKKFWIRLSGPFHFIPGQYVMISFPDDPNIRKPFSVISYDKDSSEMTLGILKRGLFTSQLFSSHKGQEILVSKAYGRFVLQNIDQKRHGIAMIAGGIGITPLFSIIEDACRNKNNIPITLFYSSRTAEEMAFLEDLQNIKSRYIKTYLFFTRERSNIPNSFNSRIEADIIESKLGEISRYRFHICGPPEMIEDMSVQLIQKRVKEEDIIIEEFR